MDMLSDGMMVGLLVFLAATTLMFCVMTFIRAQGSVKRRAAGIGAAINAAPGSNSRSLRHSACRPPRG